jgi:hypothetical protein
MMDMLISTSATLVHVTAVLQVQQVHSMRLSQHSKRNSLKTLEFYRSNTVGAMSSCSISVDDTAFE